MLNFLVGFIFVFFLFIFQTRDAVFTTIKPLVRGTVAVLKGLLVEPGEAYKEAAAKISSLHEEGFNLRIPSSEEVDQFHNQVLILVKPPE